MAKGFMTPKDLRAERDGAIASRHNRREDEPDPAMGWVVSNKPGAVPINGGRRRRLAEFRATGYRLALQRARKRNPRITRLGRYTPPRRRVPSETEGTE